MEVIIKNKNKLGILSKGGGGRGQTPNLNLCCINQSIYLVTEIHYKYTVLLVQGRMKAELPFFPKHQI